MSRAGLAAPLALWATTASAAVPLPGPAAEPGSGVSIRLESPFREPPVSGTLPLTVAIRNGSSRPGRWTLRFDAQGGWARFRYRSVHQLEAEAGGASRVELLVPLGPYTERPWARLELRVAGPGIRPEAVSLFQRNLATSSGRTRLRPSAPIAMSESLAVRHLEPIAAELTGASLALHASRFDPLALPGDWRGYAGFARIAMTEPEWRGLAPEPRRGLRRWVARGGELLLLGGEGRAQSLGFGRVLRAPASSEDERRAILAAAAQRAAPWFWIDRPNRPWKLADEVVRPGATPGLLALFVVMVAAVAGPLNLFWLCRGNRRHRVFWTTPAISLGASAAVLAVILAIDGTGGTGARWTAVALLEGDHEAVVLQEQVARTGFLLGTSFEVEPGARVEPLLLRKAGSRAALEAGRLEVAAGRLSGGWFRSRDGQAQFLEAIRPTRARVERVAGEGAEPTLLSSLPAPLETIYWLDESGRWWRAERVRPGEPAPTSEASQRDFARWWRDAQYARAGRRGRDLLGQLQPSPGSFFATSPGGVEPLETLPSIRWRDAGVVIVGRVG